MLRLETALTDVNQRPGHDSHHVLQKTATGHLYGDKRPLPVYHHPVDPPPRSDGATVLTSEGGKIVLSCKQARCCAHRLQIEVSPDMPGSMVLQR